MRQPRTFSERLALLNRLHRRQLAGAEEEEEEDESEDEAVLGVEEDDSGAELDDNLDDSDDNGSVSDSDSEDDFEGEEEPEEEEEEEEEEEPEEGSALPTTSPAVGESPGVEEPESEAPEGAGDAGDEEEEEEDAEGEAGAEGGEAPEGSEGSPTPGSMTIINPPTPTGVAKNPAVPPSSAASPGLSTTQEVVSQITSATSGETVSETASGPLASNSLAQEEQAGKETESGVESAPALGRGEQAGIVIGALAGLGLMMTLGFILFKWRKRRKASVYDRPPPPGIYGEGEKRDAEVAVAYVGEEGDRGAAPREEGMFWQVRSWIKGTADRYSRGGVEAPAPVFVSPGRNRETGSEAKWG